MGLRTLLTNFETGKQAYPFHNTPEDVGGFNYSGVNKNSRSAFDIGFSFDQKSLQFGSGTAFDRPGGGFSNEPYVRVDLGDVERSGLSRGIDSITGGLIRGGAATAARRALQDVDRIGSWLLSGKGILWIAREVGLQAANPQISSPLGRRSVANQRTFSPLNLAAQIPASITGVHIKREGNTPASFEGYADASELFGNEIDTNRLLFLHDFHIVNNVGTPQSQATAKEGGTKVGNFFRGVKEKVKQSFSKDRSGVELFTVPGGSESYYGIGNTTINKYAPFTTDAALYDQRERILPLNRFLTGEAGISSLTYMGGGADSSFGRFVRAIKLYSPNAVEFIASTVFNKGRPQLGGPRRVNEFIGKYRSLIERQSDAYLYFNQLKDFRFSLQSSLHAGSDYTERVKDAEHRSMHRWSRIGAGDPGVTPPDYFEPDARSRYIRTKTEAGKLKYNVKNVSKIDLINAMDIVRTDGSVEHPTIKDLIKFRIEAVDNDDPSKSNVMVFRAFLDTYNDNFNANHNEFRYNGRAEPFFTYEGFSRDITFSFKIAAQTRHEMKPLYRKLNYLVSQTAPEYRRGRMRAPYVKVTIGDLLDRVPGLIKSVTLTWDKNYPWEIALDDSGINGDKLDSGMLELPHILNVNVSFTPLHNFTPQRSIHAPFILPHEMNGTLDEEKKWYKGAAAKEYSDLMKPPPTGLEKPVELTLDDFEELELDDTDPDTGLPYGEDEEEVFDSPVVGQEEIQEKISLTEYSGVALPPNRQKIEENQAERKDRRAGEQDGEQSPEVTVTVDNEGSGHIFGISSEFSPFMTDSPSTVPNPQNSNESSPPRDTRSQQQRINDSILGGGFGAPMRTGPSA